MMSVTCGNIEVRFRAIGIITHIYFRYSDENVGRWTIEFLSPSTHIPR